MKSKILFVPVMLIALFNSDLAQEKIKSKGVFVPKEKGFYEQILEALGDTAEPSMKISFKADISEMDLPKSIGEFKKYWFNDPISQGRTGTCWSFSTTSYFESEVYRLFNKKVKLSEMYTVYWEYIEKARRFIREKGNSEFGQGSEANAVTRIWKQYGIVPEDIYTGMLPGQKFHDHQKMFNEMNSYLQGMKEADIWNEEAALKEIKSILNKYMLEPPNEFEVDGVKYTPQEYLQKFLQLDLNNYVDILSYMQQPYYRQVEYEVEDNWWHSKEYYNVPLDEFMQALKKAVRNGYTMSIGGDVSEAGYLTKYDVAIVPEFDIPSGYIDENARQLRFSNKTTTDDHGVHLAGYMEKDGTDWYLIKDSGAGARNGNNKGYCFYHEDYIKLKMMDFMVHKDAVKNLLKEFGK
jgi:bleomycin hydrolase